MRKSAIFLERDGIWLWLFGYGLLFRRHDTHHEVYSERQRHRCWVKHIGGWRLTIRWPGPSCQKELPHDDNNA